MQKFKRQLFKLTGGADETILKVGDDAASIILYNIICTPATDKTHKVEIAVKSGDGDQYKALSKQIKESTDIMSGLGAGNLEPGDELVCLANPGWDGELTGWINYAEIVAEPESPPEE